MMMRNKIFSYYIYIDFIKLVDMFMNINFLLMLTVSRHRSPKRQKTSASSKRIHTSENTEKCKIVLFLFY